MARFDTTLQTQMHEPFRRTRDRTIAALLQSTESEASPEWDAEQVHADKTAKKLCDCGRHAALYQDPTDGQLIQSQARCKNRLCPRCNSMRSHQLQQNIEEHLAKLNSPRMLTLTLEHSTDGLDEQLKHLYESFRRLRRSKQYKAKIAGGVAVCEVTHNNATGEWHPHLHVLVDGTFWDQKQISQAWEKASGGSKIVDIRMIHDRSKAGRYVAKYVAKIGDVNGIPAEKIPELALALHGLRMVQTSGSLYGSTNNPPGEEREEGLEYVAPLGPLADAAARGDDEAKSITDAIRKAVQCKRATDTARLHPDDERRCREAAQLLWNWWHAETENINNDTRPEPKNPNRKRGSPDRSKRLWQDAEPRADALTSGL